MVVDFDDLGIDETEDRPFLDRLLHLKAIRPDFRCTVFAVPAGHPERYFAEPWTSLPDDLWIELAVHGWMHTTPMECHEWTADRMRTLIAEKPFAFTTGFKAPGWQISDGCYEALAEADWWVADQPYNDDRRPPGLRTHLLNVGPDHWHGHVGNDCGNGLEETWDHVVSLVRDAPSFELVSEVVQPWHAPALSSAS